MPQQKCPKLREFVSFEQFFDENVSQSIAAVELQVIQAMTVGEKDLTGLRGHSLINPRSQAKVPQVQELFLGASPEACTQRGEPLSAEGSQVRAVSSSFGKINHVETF